MRLLLQDGNLITADQYYVTRNPTRCPSMAGVTSGPVAQPAINPVKSYYSASCGPACNNYTGAHTRHTCVTSDSHAQHAGQQTGQQNLIQKAKSAPPNSLRKHVTDALLVRLGGLPVQVLL